MQLVHPHDLAAVQKHADEVMRGNRSEYRIEHRVRTVDGKWKRIMRHGKVAKRDRTGRAIRLTGINADIDERKPVERMKSELVAVVNHALRTPLAALLNRSVELNEGFALQTRIRFEIDAPVPELYVRADMQRALQVVANLMSNAAKHSSPEGVVSLAASRRGDRIRFCVTDRGPGVPVEFGGRIFQSAADGYTLFMGTLGNLAVNQHL
ncbi:MAG: ATP-binding protein [Burkholderiales bacterium]